MPQLPITTIRHPVIRIVCLVRVKLLKKAKVTIHLESTQVHLVRPPAPKVLKMALPDDLVDKTKVILNQFLVLPEVEALPSQPQPQMLPKLKLQSL
jgi:hypothetical protein